MKKVVKKKGLEIEISILLKFTISLKFCFWRNIQLIELLYLGINIFCIFKLCHLYNLNYVLS